MAPSRSENEPYFNATHREISLDEIEQVIAAFGQAARRAREAGFDAAQLHAGHSYLFSQFLSPCSNRRSDEWGGSLENRMRFHLRVVDAVRAAVGRDYPLLVKLGVQDTVEGGLTLEEGCRVAQALVARGVDAIEVSEGLEPKRGNHIRLGVKLREGEAYYAPWAREVKKAVNVPVFLVGGLRSLNIMEAIVRDGVADGVSMCRPFIREPNILLRWQRGDLRPAGCLSCNRCGEKLRGVGGPPECWQEARLAEKRRTAE